MRLIKIKKGFDLNIGRVRENTLLDTGTPVEVAATPYRIPYIKPKLMVKEGDSIKRGELLYVDKHRPDIKFLSPGGGRVKVIDLGPRRVIQSIVIDLDFNEPEIRFTAIDDAGIEHVKKEEIINHLKDGGMWPFLKQFPYNQIADSCHTPPKIIVALDTGDPFIPPPEVYLRNNREYFDFGIRILERLCDQVLISVSEESNRKLNFPEETISILSGGGYPAGLPGTVLFHTKQNTNENTSWYIYGQDLVLMARMLKTGRYPVNRIVSVARPGSDDGYYMQTRVGAPIDGLIRSLDLFETHQFILGGIFNGKLIKSAPYLGMYDSSCLAVKNGHEQSFGFLRPGYKNPSLSGTFLSGFQIGFNKAVLNVDTGLHGEERACINCSKCAEICPVNLLPQFIFKAIIQKNMEEAIDLGFLDCAECGLCTYICPSKIEIMHLIQQVKADLYKEQSL